MRRMTFLACLAALTALVGATLASGQGSGRADRAVLGALSGRNEVGPNGRRGAGDPDGRGAASATIAGTQLCFGLTVKGIDTPVAAHIHRGGRRQSGPVVLELEPPTAGNPGAASGCKAISATLARQILRNPSRFYWNVHTEPFPAGAVRGQLFTRRP